LYADYCGPGIKHKAFYKMNTKEYNDAEQAEVRKLRRYIIFNDFVQTRGFG
jgi:hypothetical protein